MAATVGGSAGGLRRSTRPPAPAARYDRRAGGAATGSGKSGSRGSGRVVSACDEIDEPPDDREVHVLLKLPEHLADQLRERLRAEADPEVAVVFSDDRHASVRVGDTTVPGVLYDLPCIIETHRTFDRRQFYKVQDVSQMLVVGGEDPRNKLVPEGGSRAAIYQWPHGVSRPLKNVRKRRFRKRLVRIIEDVDDEVQRLLMLDDAAEVVRHTWIDIDNVPEGSVVGAGDASDMASVTSDVRSDAVRGAGGGAGGTEDGRILDEDEEDLEADMDDLVVAEADAHANGAEAKEAAAARKLMEAAAVRRADEGEEEEEEDDEDAQAGDEGDAEDREAVGDAEMDAGPAGVGLGGGEGYDDDVTTALVETVAPVQWEPRFARLASDHAAPSMLPPTLTQPVLAPPARRPSDAAAQVAPAAPAAATTTKVMAAVAPAKEPLAAGWPAATEPAPATEVPAPTFETAPAETAEEPMDVSAPSSPEATEATDAPSAAIEALLRAQRLATEERELNERIAEVDTRIMTKRREIGIANNPAIKRRFEAQLNELNAERARLQAELDRVTAELRE